MLKSPIQSGRREGRVIRLLPNPESANHGFIEVTETGENVFFHQRESEITASDMKRISVGTKVQFSIARNRSGNRYIAKNVYIQVIVINVITEKQIVEWDMPFNPLNQFIASKEARYFEIPAM